MADALVTPALLVVLHVLFGQHRFFLATRPVQRAGLGDRAAAAARRRRVLSRPGSRGSRPSQCSFDLCAPPLRARSRDVDSGQLYRRDYGPLDGTAIDWRLQSWRNPYELALWVLVPGLCVAGASSLGRVAPFASGVLVTLQIGVIASTFQATPRTSAEWRGPSDSMFHLSRTHNIIHIVLDAFQSDFFHEILQEQRQELDQTLSGAVFFADHAGALPTTMVSIPAMLTGTVYRQEMPLPRYVREHFDKGSLFKSLRSHGYRVDSISEIPYDNNRCRMGSSAAPAREVEF